MGRWEPDAPRRLREAALALFEEQGYEQTTVAQIAARAEVTPRTFFRHFTDKREVLFGGSSQLRDALVAAIEAAPADAAPIDAVASAIERAAEVIGADRAAARRRAAIIASPAELRERELIKLAALGDGMTEVLVARGIDTTDAALAAEAGIAVLRVAFERWTSRSRGPSLVAEIRATFRAQRSVTSS
jgi:AcrR family transcriptional regulator